MVMMDKPGSHDRPLQALVDKCDALIAENARRRSDAVNPQHYKGLDPEPIDVIEAWGLGFALGNVVKYVARADHKGDAIGDLKKAKFYIERELATREKDAER